MKDQGKMDKPLKSKKLRDSARGMDCTLRHPNYCNHNPETTVLAHLQFRGGKMGGKESDLFACFACSSCHEALDQHKWLQGERWHYMARAMVETQEHWINNGLLKVG